MAQREVRPRAQSKQLSVVSIAVLALPVTEGPRPQVVGASTNDVMNLKHLTKVRKALVDCHPGRPRMTALASTGSLCPTGGTCKVLRAMHW
jgi:hypothetical protein